eukprot:scaffold23365_cov39-Phaeocystis_antarctica.AAC.1
MEVRLAVRPHDGRVRDAVWEMREESLQVGGGLLHQPESTTRPCWFSHGVRLTPQVCAALPRVHRPARYSAPEIEDLGRSQSGRGAVAGFAHAEASEMTLVRSSWPRWASPERNTDDIAGGPSSEGPKECKRTLRACSAEARQATLSCSCCEPPPNWRAASPWPRRATESAEARARAL